MKTTSLEILADQLGGKLWTKGHTPRLYLNRGFNTKKMTTKCYITKRVDGTFSVNVKIECPTQNLSWISAQEKDLTDQILEEVANVLETHGIETVIYNLPKVKGYIMEWKEVKVPINNYGKLAKRKRKFVKTLECFESDMPKGFIQLSDVDFEKALLLQDNQTPFTYDETPF